MTIDDLKRCRTLASELAGLEQRRAALRSRATSVTQQLTDMPRGGGEQDKLATYMVQLEELEQGLIERVVELESLRQRVDRALDALPATQAQVLRLRYVQGLRWSEICNKTHYAYRQCQRFHATGLDVLGTVDRMARYDT